MLRYSMVSIFSSFDASILAAFSRSILTTSRWPDYNGTCNGVHLSISAASLLAPGSSRILIIPKCPECAAIFNDFLLFSFGVFMLDPFSWSILTTSQWRDRTATCLQLPVSSLF